MLTLAVLMNQQELYIHKTYLNRSLIMHDIDCHEYIVDREYTDLSLKTIGWQTYRRMCLIMRLSQFFVTERMKQRSTTSTYYAMTNNTWWHNKWPKTLKYHQYILRYLWIKGPDHVQLIFRSKVFWHWIKNWKWIENFRVFFSA